jgi:uncharacterized SAM-binding protein YcdF (DUF218 family)
MIFLRLALALTAIALGAFLDFAGRMRAADVQSQPIADGIVALTGGTERLDAAIRLLDKGCCKRLLITGVNADTSREDLRRRLTAEGANFDCCVDLDHAALDTTGNAVETARWVNEQGFHSLIVVTASYHMPRSLLLMSEAAPNLRLIPYAVSPEYLRLDTWWQRPATVQLLMGEFGKYLLSLIRDRLALLPDDIRAVAGQGAASHAP